MFSSGVPRMTVTSLTHRRATGTKPPRAWVILQSVLRRSNVCTDNSPGHAVSDAVKSRYVIQLERPGERVDMEFVRALLGDTGVELDAGYGPIPVNPGLGRFVVRGFASPEARAVAERIPGVRFFADALQEPAG